jgi:hypothetical protein
MFAGETVKSEVRLQAYYFAQGLLTFATLEAKLGNFRLRLDGRGQNLWPFNSADDHQSQSQNNVSLHDTQAVLTTSAALQTPAVRSACQSSSTTSSEPTGFQAPWSSRTSTGSSLRSP